MLENYLNAREQARDIHKITVLYALAIDEMNIELITFLLEPSAN